MSYSYALLEEYMDVDPVKFINIVNRYSTKEIIKLIEFFSKSESFSKFLALFAQDLLAGAILQVKKTLLQKIFSTLSIEKAANVINFISDLDDRNKILRRLQKDIRREIEEILSYPENTAGRIMTSSILIINEDNKIKDVLKKIRKTKNTKIDPIYVESSKGKFIGIINLSDIIGNNLNTYIKDLRITPMPSIIPMAHKDEVIEIATKAKLVQIPVINNENELIGMVSQNALVDTIKEDAVTKIQVMSGVSREEKALSSPFFAIKKRLPWLNINLGTVFLAAAVVALFEDTIAKFTALAVLLPVVAGQSGNTGSQALAVTMRGLTLREIRNNSWFKVSVKETLTGVINGFAIGAVTALGVYVWSKSIGLTIVAGVSMTVAMAISSVSGAIVPILLRVCKQDPAQSASIILTTITDITSFFTFLWLATFIANIIPLK